MKHTILIGTMLLLCLSNNSWAMQTPSQEEELFNQFIAVDTTEENTSFVDQLLAKGFEMNEPDETGWTLLHMLVHHRSYDIIKKLLDSGIIRYQIRDNFNQTPADLAEETKLKELIESKNLPIYTPAGLAFVKRVCRH